MPLYFYVKIPLEKKLRLLSVLFLSLEIFQMASKAQVLSCAEKNVDCASSQAQERNGPREDINEVSIPQEEQTQAIQEIHSQLVSWGMKETICVQDFIDCIKEILKGLATLRKEGSDLYSYLGAHIPLTEKDYKENQEKFYKSNQIYMHSLEKMCEFCESEALKKMWDKELEDPFEEGPFLLLIRFCKLNILTLPEDWKKFEKLLNLPVKEFFDVLKSLETSHHFIVTYLIKVFENLEIYLSTYSKKLKKERQDLNEQFFTFMTDAFWAVTKNPKRVITEEQAKIEFDAFMFKKYLI